MQCLNLTLDHFNRIDLRKWKLFFRNILCCISKRKQKSIKEILEQGEVSPLIPSAEGTSSKKDQEGIFLFSNLFYNNNYERTFLTIRTSQNVSLSKLNFASLGCPAHLEEIKTITIRSANEPGN